MKIYDPELELVIDGIHLTSFNLSNYKHVHTIKPLYILYSHSDGTSFINEFELLTTKSKGEYCVYGTDLEFNEKMFFNQDGSKCENNHCATLMIGSHFLAGGFINIYSNFAQPKVFLTKEEALKNIEPLQYQSRQICWAAYEEEYEDYVSFDPQYDDTIFISYLKKDRGF